MVGLAVTAGVALARPASLAGEYKVTDTAAIATARQYLTAQGFDLTGYQVTRAMQTSDAVAYAQDVARKQVPEIIRSYHAVSWTVRFFKPVEPVSYTVDVDARTGAVTGLRRTLPPDAPGASLSVDAALGMATTYLKQQGYDPAGLALATSSATHRDKRVDYLFAWEGKESRLPDARIRREVTIQGDKVGGWQAPGVVVPEAWSRKQQAKAGWFVLGGSAAALGGLAWMVMALIYVVRGRAPLRPLLLLAPLAILCGAGLIAAGWPSRAMAYDTNMVWSTFETIQMAGWIMFLVIPAFGLAAAWVVAAVVSRRRPEPLPWGRTAVAALALAGVTLAVSQGVGLVGRLAGLAPAELPNTSEGYLGAFRVLTIPAVAVGLELFLRVWLQSLLSRWLRSRLAGLAITAILMGAAAAAMAGGTGWPLALAGGIIDGLLYGLGYLAGGLPTVVAARSVELLASQGLQMLGAGIAPAVFSGTISLLVALALPVGVYLFGRRRPPASAEIG